MKVLQVGVGAFGKNHLRVLRELGHEVYCADLSDKALAGCRTYNMAEDHISKDYRTFLDLVDAVDVVTPADNHYEVAQLVLSKRKPVFIEKPITYNSEQGMELARLSKLNGINLQVGHLFRFNPAVKFIEDRIKDGTLGDIRFIDGKFSGFKRTRNDVGVLHTDGIHYIDLANVFFGEYPKFVYAETRDHFGRGKEDLAILLLDYEHGLAKIEVGNIQPGKSRDFTVIGSNATIIADLEGQKVEHIKAKHEFKNGNYVAVENGSERPFLVNCEPLKSELQEFFRCIEENEKPEMDGVKATNIVKIVETAYASAKEGKKLEFKPFEI